MTSCERPLQNVTALTVHTPITAALTRIPPVSRLLAAGQPDNVEEIAVASCLSTENAEQALRRSVA